MPDAPSLNALKDIHLPTPIASWPLAPGWYVLFGILFLSAAWLLVLLRTHQQKTKAKKEALTLLKQYHQHYKDSPNASLISAQINALLKRVALAYYPRQTVAHLQEEAWLDFLNQTSHGIDFQTMRTLLLTTPYQMHSQESLEPLFQGAKKWIEQRRRPCLK